MEVNGVKARENASDDATIGLAWLPIGYLDDTSLCFNQSQAKTSVTAPQKIAMAMWNDPRVLPKLTS